MACLLPLLVTIFAVLCLSTFAAEDKSLRGKRGKPDDTIGTWVLTQPAPDFLTYDYSVEGECSINLYRGKGNKPAIHAQWTFDITSDDNQLKSIYAHINYEQSQGVDPKFAYGTHNNFEISGDYGSEVSLRIVS